MAKAALRRVVLEVLLTGGVAATCAAVLVGGHALANVNVSKSGWSWGNPTPQGRTLRGIAFAGGVGYAVGSGGTALSTTNAGQSWNGLTTGTAEDLERVQVLAGGTVVVGGGAGCVTRISTNGGQIFRRIFNVAEAGCPEPVAAFSFVSPQVGFLLLRNGSLETTSDGGETFARRTAVPGTPSSSGGGALVGTDVHFLSASVGIAFVSDPNSGASSAYMTPDGGASWSPVTLPAGAKVTALHFVDPNDAYAIGSATLLRSTDGGTKWESEPIAAGRSLSSIDCSTAMTCILTVSAGNQLIETTDGGATATTKTTSSSPIYAAAYASATQIAAVGAGGATVLSADSGATFTPASADIGGQYGRLRTGPGGLLLAPGGRGDLALSTNAGQGWQVIATQTSQELIDAAFATANVGYALDASGGLQRTGNGGQSWQTLNPGTTHPARAVAALSEGTVLLIGPLGINRAVNGGRFEPIGAKPVSSAHLSDYDLAGSAVFAFGVGTHALLRSTDGGARWTTVMLPLARRANARKRKASPGVFIRSVSFTSALQGLLLDTAGRVWITRNGGRTWREDLSAGSSDGVQLAFSDALRGYVSLRSFGVDSSNAYVLRTSDGGATWHPQEIAAGSLPSDGIVAGSALGASALLDATTSGEPVQRLLFSTASGGDVTGAPASLTLATTRKTYTKRALRAAHGVLRINGTLAGAVGGENVVVSRRDLAGGPWQHQEVIAGANGGSFATTWHVGGSCVFVAQWAGDSGRPGAGSRPLQVVVR
jgi:photosystem II stability/assembly factor-like uncharacterized protein